MMSFDTIEHFHIKLNRNEFNRYYGSDRFSCKLSELAKRQMSLEISAYYMFKWTGGDLTPECFRLRRQMTNFNDRWEKPVYSIFLKVALCSTWKWNKRAIKVVRVDTCIWEGYFKKMTISDSWEIFWEKRGSN